jgi:enoyl-[acyl-carrier protein] reductase I
MFAMSYYGANRVVQNYNVMGPVKAALEAACRYLAHELGPEGIRVHAISPGPLKTRAASGIKDFELLLHDAATRELLATGAGLLNGTSVTGIGHRVVHGVTRRFVQNRTLSGL